MNGRPHSLQNRLLILVLGTVVCVWVITGALTWFDARHELDELLDGHLAQAAAILVVQQAQEASEDNHGEGLDAPFLHHYAPKVAFQVFHEGRLAMRSSNAPDQPMVSLTREFSSGFDTVELGGARWRVFSAYGSENDVQVYVGEEVHSRANILWAVLRSTLLPMALALPLLAGALWWGINHSVRPIRQLGLALRHRQPGALQPLALNGAPEEIAPMIGALNDLFARIGHLLDSERRFTADASHELRTPIAAIRAQAQVALAEVNDLERRNALANTLEGCDRAIRLVDQLLTLSRLESSDTPSMTTLDLVPLVRGVTADIAPKAIRKGQTLELDTEPDCNIAGNETLLAVLVRNLVDNAVRYSTLGARIQISVGSSNGEVSLCVEDSGPSLCKADIQRLGERFFRVPGSDENGSGLGWSIVKRIASVHHMQVRAEASEHLGGLQVTLIAPAANV
jgi:two-component system sensor histidine kinase QseC